MHTKIICDLTFAIINKCFEFENNCLKILPIGTTARNFVLYYYHEIRKERTKTAPPGV